MHGGLFGKSRAGRGKQHYLSMRFLLRDAQQGAGGDGSPGGERLTQRHARACVMDSLVRDCLALRDRQELCARYLEVGEGQGQGQGQGQRQGQRQGEGEGEGGPIP